MVTSSSLTPTFYFLYLSFHSYFLPLLPLSTPPGCIVNNFTHVSFLLLLFVCPLWLNIATVRAGEGMITVNMRVQKDTFTSHFPLPYPFRDSRTGIQIVRAGGNFEQSTRHGPDPSVILRSHRQRNTRDTRPGYAN
ncbi:hypothetical protein J6590_043814 [Homalodisca vitripennis]|nr:hypothetical protein J6590_043814 [Homalodisca vitripennis]